MIYCVIRMNKNDEEPTSLTVGPEENCKGNRNYGFLLHALVFVLLDGKIGLDSVRTEYEMGDLQI